MMRIDQYEKLQVLSEKLTDVVIDEADPANWPGAGWKPAELTKEQRGDRYWSKKNAVATLSLIGRIHQLTDAIRMASNAGTGGAAVSDTEDELDAEVAAAEKEATKLLDELQRKTKKAEFDKRVHGKSA
jgi:hypothetical protein